jgi:hypothetical protein
VLGIVVAAVTAMKLTDADITVVKELLFEQRCSVLPALTMHGYLQALLALVVVLPRAGAVEGIGTGALCVGLFSVQRGRDGVAGR